MEAKETKDTKAGTELPAENAAEVGGGDGCTTTITAGPIQIQTGGTVGDALISVYEGAVDATSHVIERVANTAK